MLKSLAFCNAWTEKYLGEISWEAIHLFRKQWKMFFFLFFGFRMQAANAICMSLQQLVFRPPFKYFFSFTSAIFFLHLTFYFCFCLSCTCRGLFINCLSLCICFFSPWRILFLSSPSILGLENSINPFRNCLTLLALMNVREGQDKLWHC